MSHSTDDAAIHAWLVKRLSAGALPPSTLHEVGAKEKKFPRERINAVIWHGAASGTLVLTTDWWVTLPKNAEEK